MWEGGKRGAAVLALSVALGWPIAAPTRQGNTLTPELTQKTVGSTQAQSTGIVPSCKGEQVRKTFALTHHL